MDSLNSQAAPRHPVHKDSQEDRLTLEYLNVAEDIKPLPLLLTNLDKIKNMVKQAFITVRGWYGR